MFWVLGGGQLRRVLGPQNVSQFSISIVSNMNRLLFLWSGALYVQDNAWGIVVCCWLIFLFIARSVSSMLIQPFYLLYRLGKRA